MGGRWFSPEDAGDSLEIDLTRPFRLTSDPAKEHRALNPGTGAPVVTEPKPGSGGGPALKGREWVLPTPETKTLETSTDTGSPTGTSTSTAAGVGNGVGDGGLGGLGDGTGDGEVDWVYLTEIPRLLNREDLLRDIQRYYPEDERRAGREGRVVLSVRIGADGRVRGAQVARGAGPLFDDAARRVMAAARFSPARRGAQTVAVRFNWPIDFQLQE
jgi:TonB family protein